MFSHPWHSQHRFLKNQDSDCVVGGCAKWFGFKKREPQAYRAQRPSLLLSPLLNQVAKGSLLFLIIWRVRLEWNVKLFEMFIGITVAYDAIQFRV